MIIKILYTNYLSIMMFIYFFFFSLYKYTVLSIIDARIQNYVCKRHYKVFNNSNNNSPVHVSKTKPCSTTSSPIHSSSSNNKHLIHTVNSLYSRLEFITFKRLYLKLYLFCVIS